MKLGLPVVPSPVAHSRNVPADQASCVELRPGDTLDSRFLLTEELNHGGMATVFKAEDLQNQRQLVAVKVPHALFASGVGAWSRFEREAEIGAKLQYPSIIKFIPVPGVGRGTYIVTEYLHGQTLEEHLRNGPLPEPVALALACRIAAALQYLHEQGVVHSDLKPGNVMLCADGSVRLIDFGMAQPVETGWFHLRAATPAMGTSDYIAPEQLQHKRGRPSADLYSFGAMLYEMLTGRAPFPGDDPFVIGSKRLTGDPVAPRKLNPKISPQVEEIILHAMQRDPARRYPTAAAMQADLATPERVRVTGLCNRLTESTRSKRVWLRMRYVAWTCVVPVVLLVLLFFLLWHHLAKGH